MSDDGWGDLLAMAAGAPSSAVSIDGKKEGYSRLGASKTKTTKRRKRNADAFTEMLDSRMKVSGEPTNSNGSCEWQFELYDSLRSLRLEAIALASEKESNKFGKRHITAIARVCFPSCLGTGELAILTEKRNRLLDGVSEKTMSFKKSVRLVMASDDLYLRLYYLQVSGALPNIGATYLPHPTTHFGALGNHEGIRNTLLSLCVKHPRVSQLYGIEEVDYHPLSSIHQQRLLESHQVFSGWSSAKETVHELNKLRGCLPTQLEYHDTPAPPLLQEWRDSCRDVLCHLFCYATVATTTIQALVAKLRELEVKSVIELGAGTGYLAKLLQPMSVYAFDVDPPSRSFNAYHGRTRPFVDVRKGTHATVFDNDAHSVALLLCYPPPQSKMACNSLQAFMNKGGRVFIHVGEWKGLTGSAEFEVLLQQYWSCIYRAPCLTWGTDAADVTIWTRGTCSKPSILLPCIKCGKFEAVRRCRLLRHAVYCSPDCFESDRCDAFRVSCLLSLVPPDLSLNFANDLHFQPLPQHTLPTGRNGGD
jgi:hypothetical protein